MIVGALVAAVLFLFLFNNPQVVDSLPTNDVSVQNSNSMPTIVPESEIVSGGPGKDDIPSIDDPQYLTLSEVDFLDDTEPGLVIDMGGIQRFYPYQILVWHEVVNDTLPTGDRILITYCPLCLSGAVFDPTVQGQQVEFGVSGKLWNSNLVLYDRLTESYWSQITGQSIAGQEVGQELRLLPSDIMEYKMFAQVYPEGQVLSTNTGAERHYGFDPYGDYYTSESLLFSTGVKDDRLENKDYVLGIVIDGTAKAYYPPTIKEQQEVHDTVAGTQLVLRYNTEMDVIRIYEQQQGGAEERIHPIGTFWYAWVGAHPETELFK